MKGPFGIWRNCLREIWTNPGLCVHFQLMGNAFQSFFSVCILATPSLLDLTKCFAWEVVGLWHRSYPRLLLFGGWVTTLFGLLEFKYFYEAPKRWLLWCNVVCGWIQKLHATSAELALSSVHGLPVGHPGVGQWTVVKWKVDTCSVTKKFPSIYF